MRTYIWPAIVLAVGASILVANLTASGDKAPQYGVLLSPQQAVTAICQGVDPIPQTALSGSCGGRLNICNALNKAATITGNVAYLCNPPTTPQPAPTDTLTPIPGTATPTPHVLLGGRDD